MRMLKIAALSAATFGLALSAHAQAPQGQQNQQQAQQMCEQIWQQADAQRQGFVTGQQAQRLNQAIQTAQAGQGMRGGTSGGAAGGAPSTTQPGQQGGQTAQRVTRDEFMSACQRDPQSFQHLRS